MEKESDDLLGTNADIKAMKRGRITKLHRGDSEMDGPYERDNVSIRHLKGVLQRSPFMRARWGNGSREVSILLDTGAEQKASKQ